MGEKLPEFRKVVRFELRATEAFAEDIDKWRCRQRPIPSRSSALRVLVRLGLRAAMRTKRLRGYEVPSEHLTIGAAL
jgi:hypothetical protein